MLSTTLPSSKLHAPTLSPRLARRQLVAAFCVALLAALVSAAPARANHPAQDHFEAAERLAKQGYLSEAIREYEISYSISPFPAIKYHIAHQYKRKASYDKCLSYVDDYLRLDPKGRLVSEATDLQKFCQAQVEALRDAAVKPKPAAPDPSSLLAAIASPAESRQTRPHDGSPGPTSPIPSPSGHLSSQDATEPPPSPATRTATKEPEHATAPPADESPSPGAVSPKSPAPGRWRLVRGPGLWAGLGVSGGLLLGGTAAGIAALILRGQLDSLSFTGQVPTDPQVLAAQRRVFTADVASDALLGGAALTLTISLIGSLRYRPEAPRPGGIRLAQF